MEQAQTQLDDKNKQTETQQQDLNLTQKTQVEVQNDFTEDVTNEIKFNRDTVVAEEDFAKTLRTEQLVEQNIQLEPSQLKLNDSNQLDSSLIYTKERVAAVDQDLDDDDKELLFD